MGGAADGEFRRDLAGHRPVQQIAGLDADLPHVDMRIGAEGNGDLGKVRQVVEDVGMQVQRDGDGHGIPHHGTNFPQELAITVLVRLRHHRAVQRHEDPVEGSAFLQPAQAFLRDLRACLFKDDAVRFGVGSNDIDRRPAPRMGNLHRSAHFRSRAREVLRNLVALEVMRGMEIVDPGPLQRERVGFVDELYNGDTIGHEIPFPARKGRR